MRTINELVIHCAATVPDWMIDRQIEDQVREIDRWHRNRPDPFRKFGYHGFQNRKGEWMMHNGSSWGPRSFSETGAHVRGRNRTTIGICIAGGHGGANTDRFSENFTTEQNLSLQDKVVEILDEFPTITRLSGHYEYAAKACPCFNVMEWAGHWLPSRRPDLWSRLISATPIETRSRPPTLRQGSNGAHVDQLQTLLGIGVTGRFGPTTEGAVKAFQRRHGLAQDGIVGRNTWAALNALPAPRVPDPTPMRGLRRFIAHLKGE